MYSEILFWDLSRYNTAAAGFPEVDFEKAIAEGIQGGFYRGTVGTSGLDYKHYQYVQQSEYYRLPWAPYHAFRPLDDARKQGEQFADLVFSGPNKTKLSRITPVFDIEVDGDLSLKELDARVRAMLLTYLSYYEKYGSRKDYPMIYTRPSFWNVQIPYSDWYKQFDLWTATWPYTSPMTVEEWLMKCSKCKPYEVKGFNAEVFWQFSANGNEQGARYGTTGDADIDLSWFNGSRDDFYNKYGVYPGSAAAPPPPPPSTPIWIVNPDKCKAVNFRSEPRVSTATLKGALTAREEVCPTGEMNGLWMQVAIPHKYWIYSTYLKKQ